MIASVEDSVYKEKNQNMKFGCTVFRVSSSVAALLTIAVALTVTLLLLRDHQAEANDTDNSRGSFPIFINTWGFANATEDGWLTLLKNGSAMDAIVAAGNRCQVEQCDHTVGWGGSPDENGETTLDAMIMDGPSHSVGSVAALRRVKNAILVARAVLEHTEHTLLVGDQATAFAVAMGFTNESLTSAWSTESHRNWLANDCQPNFWRDVTPDPRKHCGPYSPIVAKKGGQQKSPSQRQKHTVDRFHHDTIGAVAIDAQGHIASGTSTNGAAHKIPGRVGDSPIVGAGSYCDEEVGGAAATGDGDIILRYLVSYQAVENLRRGMSPEDAAKEVLGRIPRKFPTAQIGLVVVSSKTGVYAASCLNIDGGFPFMVAVGPAGVVKKVAKCI